MNFTSPLKSNKANNLFESPSCYMSPSAFERTNDQNTNSLNVINTPFNCNSIQQNRSPPASQFKTPSKYSDRFIPARADSISKTLFDLKDEMIIEEQPTNKLLNESPLTHNGIRSHQGNSNASNSNSTTINGFSNGHTTNSSHQFTTPSKKANFSAQLDENTKSYNELIQRELFGAFEGSNNKKTTEELQKTPILKFHWDQKNATTSPISSIQQSPFQISTPDDRTKEQKRKISKTPFKVLDAPGLQDDFYVDLLDWSSQNLIGVGLGKAIFIWNAVSGSVSKLCENTLSNFGANMENYQGQQQPSFYTSLKWSPNGNFLAIGNQIGQVELWDLASQKSVRTFHTQTERIGSIDFNNNNVFASGSKDKSILIQDIRDPKILKMAYGHKQEICQVKWSPDQQYLASGGNDNMVAIWDINRSTNQNPLNSNHNEISPYQKHSEHKAAVRALAWNPHQYGILLSGGGSRDQTIKIWNVNTNSLQGSVEVGSQVCKLQFSPDQNEFVCAHGFEYNKITVWKYPTMSQLAELEGHQSRVLFMSMAPDNQTIVSGAGDETLKFWKIFQGKPASKQSSLLKHSDLR